MWCFSHLVSAVAVSLTRKVSPIDGGSVIYAFGSVVYPAVATIKSSKCPPDEQGRVLGALNGTAHSSKERRRPLLLQPFLAVTEPPPGLLVPLSGILASRRRKPRKNEKKRGKNGRDMA